MSEHQIQNFEQVARTPARRDALEILEAGYQSINTVSVVAKHLQVTDDTLTVRGQTFPIKGYENIFLIGFGKGSCAAVYEVHRILSTRIKKGVVIDRSILQTCPVDIEAFAGTHPLPSEANVKATLVLEDVAEKAGENDLVLVVVAGGGSSLLCSSTEECNQNTLLFEECLKAGAAIEDLNLVRRHLSSLKGGGLAKVLYPATVISLVFSDIVGGHPEEVASGPTYFDPSKCSDALAVLKRLGIAEKFTLNETPKDQKYFEKVHNIVLISNEDAVDAMAHKAQEKGYTCVVIPEALYETPERIRQILSDKKGNGVVVFAGGETRYQVPTDHGAGGRCQFFELEALPYIEGTDVFVAAASDGRDNSDKAGAIIDTSTLARAHELGIDIETARKRCDTISLFEKVGDELLTGPTQANVSDWYFLLTPHQ